jgi:hypothetical protein
MNGAHQRRRSLNPAAHYLQTGGKVCGDTTIECDPCAAEP